MTRWFRHYAGMMRDDKLVRAALKAKQPIERVVWIWGAILESAAEIDDGGRYDFDEAEASYFLRADEADIHAVLAALTVSGRLAEGRVVKWSERQFQSDRSAARQAAYRERRRTGDGRGDDNKKHGSTSPAASHDDQVTSVSRHGDAPDTELDTETEKEKREGARNAPAPSKRGTRLSEDWTLSPANFSFAEVKGIPPARIQSEAEKFRDHWIAKPGKDGVKLDWDATWRTWVAKACEWGGFAPLATGGAIKSVVWVSDSDGRWPDLAERFRKEHGKDPPKTSGMGGQGRHFSAEWVSDLLEIPPELRRTA